MTDLNDHVAGKIKQISTGVITQNRLARCVGLSGPTLSLKMTGASKFSLEQIYLIADVLNVHPFALLPEPEDIEWDDE